VNYVIIQFRPNLERGEVANIGVVASRVEFGHAEFHYRLDQDLVRAVKFFGDEIPGGFDRARIATAGHMFVNRLRRYVPELRRQDVDEFLRMEPNNITSTPVMYTVWEDEKTTPERNLAQLVNHLYDRCVADPQKY
jgi:hypothetical protein